MKSAVVVSLYRTEGVSMSVLVGVIRFLLGEYLNRNAEQLLSCFPPAIPLSQPPASCSY
jgi:hypothetical protein